MLDQLDKVIQEASPQDRAGLIAALSERLVTMAMQLEQDYRGPDMEPRQGLLATLSEKQDAGLLTAKEAATRLGVGKSFLYELTARGELPVVELGERCIRFRPVDIDTFARKRTRRRKG